jgi:predicted histone-like DNA-binding protein
MIKYKVVKHINHLNNDGEKEGYFPRITNRIKLTSDDIAKIISRQSSFTKADVKGVIEAFIENIPDLLLDNYTVSLDNFGTFSLHAGTKSESQESKVSARNIKDLRISFRPSVVVKEKLKRARFKKAE